MCVICQKSKNLVPVTAVKSLKIAMEQRDDKVTDRLKTDVARPDWIAKSSPKWHAHCQNDYTHNLWPANLEKRVSCKCKKGCRKNCSC